MSSVQIPCRLAMLAAPITRDATLRTILCDVACAECFHRPLRLSVGYVMHALHSSKCRAKCEVR